MSELESGRYKVPFKVRTKNRLKDLENCTTSLHRRIKTLEDFETAFREINVMHSLMIHGMDIADIKSKLKIGDLESEIVKQDMDKPHYEGNTTTPIPPYGDPFGNPPYPKYGDNIPCTITGEDIFKSTIAANARAENLISQDDDYAHSSPLGKQGGGYVMKSDVNRVIDEVFYTSALYKNSIGSDAKQALLEAISKL